MFNLMDHFGVFGFLEPVAVSFETFKTVSNHVASLTDHFLPLPGLLKLLQQWAISHGLEF